MFGGAPQALPPVPSLPQLNPITMPRQTQMANPFASIGQAMPQMPSAQMPPMPLIGVLL